MTLTALVPTVDSEAIAQPPLGKVGFALRSPFSRAVWVLLLLSLGWEAGNGPAQAQPIPPSIQPDLGPGNLNTQVDLNPAGDRYNISGGTASDNGVNLFHGFSQFGLGEAETARFFVNATIQNILGRVTGGTASEINGTLEVFNNANPVNLWLMNPSGIIFGPNVQLDLPGAFTATTATGIRLGDGNWFYANGGTAGLGALGANPDGFAFELTGDAAQAGPGEILLEGGLALPSGGDLTLVAGGIAATGDWVTSGGDLRLATVDNGQRVILSQPGSVLQFDIRTSDLALATNPWTRLPQVLTGGRPSQPGAIVLGNLNTSSTVLDQPGGDVLISSQESVTVGNINTSHSPQLTREAVNNANGDSLESRLQAIAGNVAIEARQGSIVAGNVTAEATSEAIQDNPFVAGGEADLVFVGELLAEGGAVELKAGLDLGTEEMTGAPAAAGDLTVGQVSSQAWAETVFATARAASGPISLTSQGPSLTAGRLSSQAQVGGYAGAEAIAGDVTLEARGLGDRIVFDSIDSSAITRFTGFGDEVLRGGDVSVSVPGLIQGRGEIVDLENSETGEPLAVPTGLTIRTDAVIERFGFESEQPLRIDNSGSIRLTHDGGPSNVAIGIGSALGAGSNGTLGGLQAGPDNTVDATNGVFPVQGTDSSITLGRITITALNSPPGLDGTDLGDRAQVGERRQVSYAALAPRVSDDNLDNVTLQVEVEDPAFQLSLDGVPVTEGATLEPGQTLSYVVPEGSEPGRVLVAFRLRASDGPGQSDPLPYSITVDPEAIDVQPDPQLPPPPELPPLPELPELPDRPEQPEAPEPVEPVIEPETFNPEQLIEIATSLQESQSAEVDSSGGEGSASQDGVGSGPIAFNPYANTALKPVESLEEAAAILQATEQAAGVKPALVYIQFVPKEIQGDRAFAEVEAGFSNDLIRYFRGQTDAPSEAAQTLSQGSLIKAMDKAAARAIDRDQDELELLVVMPSGEAVRQRLDGVTRSQVIALANHFRREVTDRRKLWSNSYLGSSQQLYNLLIRPIEGELNRRGIENLSFILDAGLRSLPMGALHDGQGFLVERYSIGLMPSLSLADTRYVDVRNAEILAMGASEFEELAPLPAVESELALLTQQLWRGSAFFNERFTLENLIQSRSRSPYGIVHLATHGEFKSGRVDESYIQLWDQRLQLHQLEQLGFNNPPLELLVLSACRTALGDEQAELGFAGLAVKSGAKSALGSLWAVSDLGTLALISEFYEQLGQRPIKAEALRQAQLSLLRNQVTLEAGQTRSGVDGINLAAMVSEQAGAVDLSHPYYWSAFTLVGNPW